MRRQDKKMSDPNLIERVIQKGTVVHIAMMDGDKPYQIPLNYGYKDNSFYIHSAREGKKIELLKENSLVHFQIETGVEVKNTDQAYRCGTNYECVMGYGRATIVDDPREKMLGANILMNHYREGWGHKHQYKGCLTEIFIIRIDIDTDTVTGKKSENRVCKNYSCGKEDDGRGRTAYRWNIEKQGEDHDHQVQDHWKQQPVASRR